MRLQNAKKILWDILPPRKDPTSSDEVIKLLKHFEFFSELSRGQLHEISPLFFAREYLENEFLFEHGQPGAALFIIQEGEVSIEIPADATEFTQVAVLRDGNFVGELALLDSSPRSASARALKPTKALALFRNDLGKLMESHPEIAVHIYKGLAQVVGDRLKATNELIHDQN